MKRINIKKYLQKAYEMESFVYELRRVKHNIEWEIQAIENGDWRVRSRRKMNSRDEDYPSFKQTWAWTIKPIWIICFIVMGWIGFGIAESGYFTDMAAQLLNGEALIEIIGWINILTILEVIPVVGELLLGALGMLIAIVILALGLIFWFPPAAAVVFGVPFGCVVALITLYLLEKIYERKHISEYEDRLNEDNREADYLNALSRERMTRKLEALESELEVIDDELQTAEQILERFYEKGVIFEKYRNFVAVSSFYEYLESGRCTQLTGHEGAYNIYETEIRQNIIISKLSEIIEHLKKIEENQYMIYSAIERANQSCRNFSAQITSSLSRLGDGIDSLNENAKIIAYHTGISAKNTEFLKWVKVIEMISDRS